MKDDMMQMIKERLLNELIDKMSGDDRMAPPKGVGVEVQAPDKAGLAEGLGKAKDLLDKGAVPEPEASAQHDPEDDEERMLQLLAEDDHDGDEI